MLTFDTGIPDIFSSDCKCCFYLVASSHTALLPGVLLALILTSYKVVASRRGAGGGVVGVGQFLIFEVLGDHNFLSGVPNYRVASISLVRECYALCSLTIYCIVWSEYTGLP